MENTRPTTTSDLASTQPQERAADTEAEHTELTGHPAGTNTQTLLDEGDADGFRQRWSDIQVSFVDEPRRSVEQADALVAEVMQNIASSFARTRSALEGRWSGGGKAGTEELRVALRQYRSFFELLLRR